MPKASAFAERASAIAGAARRWTDADFPPRVRVQGRIVRRTGYSLPVVEYALDALFGSISREALVRTIERELAGYAFAPLPRVAIVSSRTTIGVAIVPALFAICAGCDVLVKDREDALVAAFFETLAQELSEPQFSAEVWSGPQRDLSSFDAVVAFGGHDALAAIRARLAPEARFIGYGPKASIGYVAREALASERAARAVARGAARDLVLYDGEGCLSLHALFVEDGAPVAADRFTALLAEAVKSAAVEFPLGERDDQTAARAARARDLAVFRGGPVYSDAEASFMLETGSLDRAPAFAPRALAVHAVDGSAEMQAYVAHHALPLEACAVASARDDVVAAAIEAGANRIAPFGELQRPPLGHPHGGRPRFSEFVRFAGVERA